MSLGTAILIFIGCAAVIAYAGTLLTRRADQLADLTGMGEAFFGAVFLGGITSLSGITTSVTAAIDNHPELAVSNAIGGIAAQTVFLSVADIVYPKTNLEHASASLPNLMEGVLLIMLMALVVVGITTPSFTIVNIHPTSFLLVIVYVWGTRLIAKAKDAPMWKPKQTKETVEDVPEQENLDNLSLKSTLIQFILLAVVVAFAGYGISKTGIIIADKSGLSEQFVGSLFTAVATSLPELVVSISAVRQKALTMAVANIIGGNTFDVLFVAFADVGYTEGSILHTSPLKTGFIVSETIMLTAILLLGLLHRQKRGFAGIGWESAAIIVIYILSQVYIYFSG